MEIIYLLSLILFCIGLYGVLSHKNLLIILMSIEIMFNSCLFLLVATSSANNNADGGAFFLIVIAIAACEVAIGLSLTIALFRKKKSLDVTELKKLRG